MILPHYDFENDVLNKNSRAINANKVTLVFVEGMFIFKHPKLRELLDFNIFVEVDDDIRLSRLRKEFKTKNKFL